MKHCNQIARDDYDTFRLTSEGSWGRRMTYSDRCLKKVPPETPTQVSTTTTETLHHSPHLGSRWKRKQGVFKSSKLIKIYLEFKRDYSGLSRGRRIMKRPYLYGVYISPPEYMPLLKEIWSESLWGSIMDKDIPRTNINYILSTSYDHREWIVSQQIHLQKKIPPKQQMVQYSVLSAVSL